jgi:hypothetical protein
VRRAGVETANRNGFDHRRVVARDVNEICPDL